MDLADVCKIEVVSCQVQTEAARRGIVGGAAGDDGIVVIEMDIVEGQLTVIEMEVGIELLDGLTVGGGVVELDLTFAVSIRPGTGGFEGQIGCTGDGIVVSGERLPGSEVAVVELGADRELTVGGEMTVFKRGRSIEIGGRVVATQSGIAQSDGLEGNLEGGRERIPMGVERVRIDGGGDIDIEVVDRQNAGKLRR